MFDTIRRIKPSSFRIYLITLLGLLCLYGCRGESKRFEDIPAKKSGISFENKLVTSPELNILNYLYFYNGAGVASADFNNDGLQDLYFVSNMGADKLFLNRGDLKFEDITTQSGIVNNKAWSTGVSVVDINQDGLTDIYISKIGGFKPEFGHNQLWLNTGVENGTPKFREAASEFGLDLMLMSTHSAFFDYDLDNDLDLFLLNHSIYPNRSYGKGSTRSNPDPISGDRLYENRDGKFYDITEQSGIFQGRIGYGLGITIGDLNNDNYPDIYVGNDFFENDYLYINNQDGTFSEQTTNNPELLGHTTHFSMGNTMSDLNNDGNLDIISLDMLPEDLVTYKTSAQEYNYQIYSNYLRNGYAPQYMQNTLHLNRGDGKSFSEIAHLSGISSTEWSWSVEAQDFDNDGQTDIYISNGILGATNDMDFINFIANEAIQRGLDDGVSEQEAAFIDKIPEKHTEDYFFRNLGDGKFEDVTDLWLDQIPSFSHGAISVDLDNDGDLELVINTVNSNSRLIKNNSVEQDGSSFLKVNLNGPAGNPESLGAKVSLYSAGSVQYREQQSTHSYLSSSLGPIHFGLGTKKSIDSVKVHWPDGKSQIVMAPELNKTIEFNYNEALANKPSKILNSKLFLEHDSIPFLHTDNSSVEFNREPLIPFAGSNTGPDFTISDFNQDGLDDVFMCGAKGQPSRLFYQSETGEFIDMFPDLFALDKLSEDVSSIAADYNNDGYTDIIVVSGGNEFDRGLNIRPRLYLNSAKGFNKKDNAFSNISTNASVIKDLDIDKDGDLDLIIGSNQKGFLFAESSKQLLLLNDGSGNFTDNTSQLAPALNDIGHITDIEVADLNKDGLPDLVVAGYWESIRLLINSNGGFNSEDVTELPNSSGWWNCVEVTDLDKDGELDIIAGNWGLNSRLKASAERPITLYLNDFDNNGKIDPILTHFYGDVETTFASKEDLAKQMPFINKNYLSFADFSKASVRDIFGAEKLREAEIKRVDELANCVFFNRDNLSFEKSELPFFGQISSVNAIDVRDYNNDGFPDLLLTGNYYEISTQLSRLDASQGELFINDQKGGFEFAKDSGLNLNGVVQDLELLQIKGEDHLLVGRNNLTAKVFKITVSDE